MNNLRPFQIALLGTFAFAALAGVIFLILYTGGPGSGGKYGDSVEVWGTLGRETVREIFAEIQKTDNDFRKVSYMQFDPRSFDNELVNAIAEGRSPDLIILSHESLVTHKAKLLPINYESISERTFRDTFVDGTEIFLAQEGIYGIPLAVDPMVLYWNRDLLSSSGVAAPPRTWEELTSVTVPRVTKGNSALDITTSAVALGEYANVRYAKDILSMMLLQAGSEIVTDRGQFYEVTLNDTEALGLPPGVATLTFYTQFALPTHAHYSWNRSLPEDHFSFLSGDLGLYFAPGSVYDDLERENPNLNFDVAAVPQGAGATILRDFGIFYALSIPRGSDNPNGAFAAMQVLTSKNVSTAIADAFGMAPLRREAIGEGTADPYRRVLYDMALISRGWLDPNPQESENVFKQMIEDVTSGRSRIGQAISDSVRRLELLF